MQNYRNLARCCKKVSKMSWTDSWKSLSTFVERITDSLIFKLRFIDTAVLAVLFPNGKQYRSISTKFSLNWCVAKAKKFWNATERRYSTGPYGHNTGKYLSAACDKSFFCLQRSWSSLVYSVPSKRHIFRRTHSKSVINIKMKKSFKNMTSTTF